MARLLLFGGKGGVGKTTTSSATAVWLADSGLRVLLVSSDPAHSTSDSLNVELGPVPTPVEGVPGLFGLEMDPEAKLSNLLPKVGEAMNNMGGNGGMGGLGGLGMMLDPNAKQEFEDMKSDVKTADMILPGLDEALAFDELLKHMENPTWDVVVFDTAPTGHTLRFLSLPELIEAWSGRLLRLMRVSGGIRSMLFGRKESDAMKEELERFRRRVLHVRRVLSDPATSSFTLVTIPERMGINETLRAHESLLEYRLPIGGCLVNRLTPVFEHPFLANRRTQELERIAELEGGLEGVNVASLELAEQEIVGGFHTEYSSIRFALFFLAEFMNQITMGALLVTLFLGGPNGPALFFPEGWWIGVFWFFVKLMGFLFLLVWVRATLPRFRYDQLMDFGWKLLIPLSLGWFILLAFIQIGRDEDWSTAQFVGLGVGLAAVFVALAGMLTLAIRNARNERIEEMEDAHG